MSLSIAPHKHITLNCLESQIISIALSWGRRYESMFLGKWGFAFRERETDTASSTGDRIITQMDDTFHLLERYHGIKIVEHQILEPEQMISLIRSHLESTRPVILFVDSFWCPWDPGYQKYHNMHFVIITGIDEEQMALHCVDGFYSKEHEILSLEDLHHYCSVCYSVHELDQPTDSPTVEEVVTHTYRKLFVDNHMGHSIIEFSNELLSHFDFDEEVKSYKDKWWASPLFKRLIKVSQARLLFAEALQYLDEDKFQLPISELRLAARSWENVRVMLIKAVHVADQTAMMNRVVAKLVDIASHEGKILVMLLESTQLSYDQNGNLMVNNRSFHVPLNEYMNNRTFGSFQNPCPTGQVPFFLAHDLPTSCTWELQHTSFQLQPYDGESNDNMVAKGQTIDIKTDRKFQFVHFLATFLDDTNITVSVELDNNDIQVFQVSGVHWLASKAEHKGQVAYSGQLALKKEEGHELIPILGRMVSFQLDLGRSRNIHSITFQENSLFQLFALTLA